MNERFSVVFEVYRYAVCWLCVAFALIFAFLVLVGFFSPVASQTTPLLAAQGSGFLLALAIFVLHWRLKNPHGG
jgi:NO-binding membrane sensor protein with MHYT domain